MPALLLASTPDFLGEVAIVILSAAIIAYLCYRAGLVPIVGFLVAGVLIGPKSLGLVQNQELIDAAAETGVLLLLFMIGIEFSLEKLAKIQRLIFGGGGLQVALATSVTAVVLVAAGVNWKAAVFTGFLVALSSTAIVLKLLAERGETNTGYGQASLGILIFQDLAVIVMVLLVPALGGHGGSLTEIFIALAKAAAIIALVLIVARRFMPAVLEKVARTCSPELFLLSVIAICFGTAFLTSLAGVSVSLGAFLAGLVVSESRFSQQAFSEIAPLQILFSATFFISVGMLLDVEFLMHEPLIVLGTIGAALIVKVVTTGLSVRLLGYPAPVAVMTAVALAQVGEFSFVLERAGREVGLTPAGMGDPGSQTIIAATVVLMVLTPALVALGGKLGNRFVPAERVADTEPESPHSGFPEMSDHVIVSGYGLAARRLVRVLDHAEIPYVIVTLSPAGANEAEAEGRKVLRGDSTRVYTLQLAGLERARTLVIADDDPGMAHRIASVARGVRQDIGIVIRSRLHEHRDALIHAGADEVYSEEIESIAGVGRHVLRHYGKDSEQVLQTLRTGGSGVSAYVEFKPEEGTCEHVGQIRPVLPGAKGCEECLRAGDAWVHLRICMICGHVGCCDSSRNQHATRHYHESGHPIVRSFEPGEVWGWCYADERML